MPCLFCRPLAPDDPILLLATDHWRVVLHGDQSYLGRCTVAARAHRSALAALSAGEWLDFSRVVARLEAAVRDSFGAAVCNWSCLMNGAFRDPQPDPHVHWHFRPRYAAPVIVGEWPFADPDFARHYDPERREVVPELVKAEIAHRLRQALIGGRAPF